METGTYFRAILLQVILLPAVCYGAPPENNVVKDFRACQSTYQEVKKHIETSEGEEAAATIWRLVFHSMDLDGNEKLASAEIALFFELQKYVHESDVMDVMKEVDSWIKLQNKKGGELTLQDFQDIIDKTMGMKIGLRASYFHVAYSMCHIFTSRVPHLAESMTELESCTKRLETSILADKTERAEYNSWYAIFETFDSNEDRKINHEELIQRLGKKLSDDERLAVLSALGYAIYGTVHHDVSDISEHNFYVFVHELLYGLSGGHRQHSWGDVYDEAELKGRSILCSAIYNVRKDITGQRDVMTDCIHSYQATKQKILGEDGVFAPEIVFTMVDVDRNGKISQEEFNSFIGSPSTLYSAIGRKHASKSLEIKEFRSVMPDKMVDGESSDENKKFELSAMTSSELKDAEKLCYAIITSVQSYPNHNKKPYKAVDTHSSADETFRGPGSYMDFRSPPPEEPMWPTEAPPVTEILHMTDAQGEPIEIEIRHSVSHHEETMSSEHSQRESFMGMGHYETKYEPEEESTTSEPMYHHGSDSGLAPPERTRSHNNNEGVLYHGYDDDGNPIQIHMSQDEIENIMHRMTAARQPASDPVHSNPMEVPMEPPHEDVNTEEPPTERPPTEEPRSDVENELMAEISRILHARQQEEQEQETEDEETQLKNLLESMENGADRA